MALLPIYNCFHPVMRKKTNPVVDFDGSLKQLVDDMHDTLRSIKTGVGLAANQVGESLSVIVLDLSKTEEHEDAQQMTLINPVIEYFSDEEYEDTEGCLSIPAFYDKVVRPYAVQVRYTDVDMKEYTIEAEEFYGRVLQHEIDHLDGKLFFERMTPLRRALTKSKLKKIERGDVVAEYPMILPNGKLIQPE
jgi:peptide deformylase